MESAPGTHWIRGLVDLRVGLYAVVKRKIPRSCTVLERPIIQPVAQLYTTELSRLEHRV
jgi:hypothetical protein